MNSLTAIAGQEGEEEEWEAEMRGLRNDDEVLHPYQSHYRLKGAKPLPRPMLPRTRNSNLWINMRKTRHHRCLHILLPFPLHPPALPFEGINHSPMAPPPEA